MFECDDEPAGPLITLRLAHPLHDLAPGESLLAYRIADHRRRYLHYEGTISGGRGSVRRLASGRLRMEKVSKDHWRLELEWDSTDGSSGALRQILAVDWSDDLVCQVGCITRETAFGDAAPAVE